MDLFAVLFVAWC